MVKVRVQRIGYEPYGEIYQDGKKVREDNDLERLLLTGLLCNTASVYEDGEQWKIDGIPQRVHWLLRQENSDLVKKQTMGSTGL
jgi:hypothetical protein